MNRKTLCQRIQWVVVLIACLIISGCNPTTNIRVLQPAKLTLPDHVDRIAMVDRSKPEKGFLNVLEGLVTGEEIGQDRRGRVNAMQGLADALTRTPRFEIRYTGIELTGSKSGDAFAPPLPWSEIQNICSEYDADAVAAIEMFDTDSHVSIREFVSKEKEEDEEIEITKYEATRNGTIQIGWRLYDGRERVILDQFTVEEDFQISARGKSEEEARQNLNSQTEISEHFGFDAGVSYGMRIAPVYVEISRTFYKTVKGVAREKMEQAARYAEANDWLKAATIWQPLASHPPNAETGGRCAYNMAVANEVQGKLTTALDWAKRSYVEYGNKKAKSYLRTLEQRLDDQYRVKSQMNQ